MSQTKSARIDARMPSHVKEAIEMAAAMEGRTTSDFLINSAYRRAEEIIANHSVIRLSVSGQKRLAELLQREETEPSEFVRQAVRDFRDRVV